MRPAFTHRLDGPRPDPVRLYGDPHPKTVGHSGGQVDARKVRNAGPQPAGATHLEELTATFKACRLLVDVDTAAIHIAAAVGTPKMSLFGPSDQTT